MNHEQRGINPGDPERDKSSLERANLPVETKSPRIVAMNEGAELDMDYPFVDIDGTDDSVTRERTVQALEAANYPSRGQETAMIEQAVSKMPTDARAMNLATEKLNQSTQTPNQ